MTEKIAIIECVATVLSLGISLIALYESYQQIKLSNKQNLFNERVRIYLLIHGLMELYKENMQLIENDRKDEIYWSSDFILNGLINNSYLEKMAPAISKPLHQPEQKVFLSMIEELKNEAEKTKFIFNKSINKYLYNFIISYEETLMQLYKYIVLIDSMRKIQEQSYVKKDIHEVAKEVDEKKHREELFDKIEKLKESYNYLIEKDIINNIEKQIKL